jgi:hypothetical protein
MEERSGAMILPANALIARAKMINYLLAWRRENDKSEYLAQAGYTAQDPDRLADDIRRQLLPLEAQFEETNEYGDKFRIRGTLTGPNGRALHVVSIWMTEITTGMTKFITLYPEREN